MLTIAGGAILLGRQPTRDRSHPHTHASVRTIGILPTKPKARDAGSIAAPANAIRLLFYDYFINVIGTSARWMTFMATEPRSSP